MERLTTEWLQLLSRQDLIKTDPDPPPRGVGVGVGEGVEVGIGVLVGVGLAVAVQVEVGSGVKLEVGTGLTFSCGGNWGSRHIRRRLAGWGFYASGKGSKGKQNQKCIRLLHKTLVSPNSPKRAILGIQLQTGAPYDTIIHYKPMGSHCPKPEGKAADHHRRCHHNPLRGGDYPIISGVTFPC